MLLIQSVVCLESNIFLPFMPLPHRNQTTWINVTSTLKQKTNTKHNWYRHVEQLVLRLTGISLPPGNLIDYLCVCVVSIMVWERNEVRSNWWNELQIILKLLELGVRWMCFSCGEFELETPWNGIPVDIEVGAGRVVNVRLSIESHTYKTQARQVQDNIGHRHLNEGIPWGDYIY